MDDNNKVDALKAISNVHRSQFNERRQYEWKVLLLTLGIYAAILASKYTGSVHIPSTSTFYVCFWIMAFLLAVISSMYLWFLNRANKVNQDFAHVAEDALMEISGNKNFDGVKKSLPKFVWQYWSYAFQLGTIILFALATVYIVLYT
jgi:hypothetical protein